MNINNQITFFLLPRHYHIVRLRTDRDLRGWRKSNLPRRNCATWRLSGALPEIALACHTTSKGKPYAGGAPISTTDGSDLFNQHHAGSRNGIGHTYGQFRQSHAEGVTDDGDHLYPAMPYTSYAKVLRKTVGALCLLYEESSRCLSPNHPTKIEMAAQHSFLMMSGWALFEKGRIRLRS